MFRQNGFTLIEILIVVAILGVLSAIALPVYSKYQARAKVAGAFAEISALKTAVQLSLDQGNDISNAGMAGGTDSTGNCSAITVTATASSGTSTITCTLANAPSSINGRTLTWTRTEAAGWSCNSNITAEFLPSVCTGT
ncbi:pilin [Pseudomonas sp.]|uniref:pilin n=1 Tax=Pseudomonas sp. TaxID=306 RepID=UPI0025864264|nr:pilin [Pseudomonas sp.]